MQHGWNTFGGSIADSERTARLKSIRTEMVEKRFFLLNNLFGEKAASDEKIYGFIEALLKRMQQVIDIIYTDTAEEKNHGVRCREAAASCWIV